MIKACDRTLHKYHTTVYGVDRKSWVLRHVHVLFLQSCMEISVNKPYTHIQMACLET